MNGHSGLPWVEGDRRLGGRRRAVRRWAEGRARPNYQHRKALVELADSPGLGRLFTD